MADRLEEIKDAVVNREKDQIVGLISQAVGEGLDPEAIINQALIEGMDIIGRQFAEGQIFVPEMLVSAMVMKMGLEEVKPLLSSDQGRTRGKILIGTVKGDLHDIGKNLVVMMLEGAGFEVVDLGINLDVGQVVERVKALKPDILGLSALLTTTMPEMKKVIEELQANGLRESVKVIVGGAPVNDLFAQKIGADGFGANAAEAVELARRLTS